MLPASLNELPESWGCVWREGGPMSKIADSISELVIVVKLCGKTKGRGHLASYRYVFCKKKNEVEGKHTFKRLPAGENFPKYNAEGIDISFFVEDLCRHHLGCHPKGRAFGTFRSVPQILAS